MALFQPDSKRADVAVVRPSTMPSWPQLEAAMVERMVSRRIGLRSASALPRRASGEAVASALHDLLRDTHRLLAMILGTLWPEHLSELTARTVGITDPQAHARELLASTKKIYVSIFLYG